MIIIIDNASIHHNLGLDDILLARGLSIEYLPPYSPDFNPIEMTFHTLKTWIQRHNDEIQFFLDFGDFLRMAVERSVSGNIDEYFRRCGYKHLR